MGRGKEYLNAAFLLTNAIRALSFFKSSNMGRGEMGKWQAFEFLESGAGRKKTAFTRVMQVPFHSFGPYFAVQRCDLNDKRSCTILLSVTPGAPERFFFNVVIDSSWSSEVKLSM